MLLRYPANASHGELYTQSSSVSCQSPGLSPDEGFTYVTYLYTSFHASVDSGTAHEYLQSDSYPVIYGSESRSYARSRGVIGHICSRTTLGNPSIPSIPSIIHVLSFLNSNSASLPRTTGTYTNKGSAHGRQLRTSNQDLQSAETRRRASV